MNGKLAGTHKGGSSAFSYDITKYLKRGESKEIVVSVWDPTDTGNQARGKQQLEPRYLVHARQWDMANGMARAGE